MRTIIYPVADLARAKILYTKLPGVEPYIDSPYAHTAIGMAELPLNVPFEVEVTAVLE